MTPRPDTPSTAARFADDRGSLIPEFLLAAPLMIVLLMAIYEFGMGFREKINVAAAVRSTARQVSNLGDARPADYEALQGFRSTMARARHVAINRVVIYEATGLNGEAKVPACLTTIPAGGTPNGGFGFNDGCNIYNNDQIQNLGAPYTVHFGGTAPNLDDDCANTAWDQFWCPANERFVNQGDPPDYVGVYTNLSYTSYTKFVPGTITMTDRSVYRIEPKVT